MPPLKKDDVLSQAKKHFEITQTEQVVYRQNSIDSIKFVYNIDHAQWNAQDVIERTAKRRPFLTHNKTRKFVKQVANRERDNRMSMKVKPVDDKADPIIAAMLTDYFHGVEHRSKAPRIYTKNGEKALAGGFGYWRLLTEYEDDSFDQQITIKDIENQFNVYLDHARRWGFILEGISYDDFKREYPDAEPVSAEMGATHSHWFEKDRLFIAEYFYKEPKKKKIAEVIHSEDIDGNPEVMDVSGKNDIAFLESQGFEILRTRNIDGHVVKWCKMSGNDILEGWDDGNVREWVGKEIPIIECKGDEIMVDGKVYKMSMIEDGKDPQRMYNYFITAQTERYALASKAPTLLTPDQIEGHEQQWKNSNVENYAYLLYNPDGTGSQPKRNEPPSADMGAIRLTEIGDKDIKDGLGMYDSSFGGKSNERTGKAITARTSRSDMGTFHYIDNLAEAIEETTRQMIDIAPKVVDTQRFLRGRSYEGEEVIHEVNITSFDPTPQPGFPDGVVTIKNDLSLGRYDVEPDVKIWSTRREEASANMKDSMQYAPEIAPIIAKYLFKFSNTPGHEELEKEITQWIAQQQETAKANAGQPKKGQ